MRKPAPRILPQRPQEPTMEETSREISVATSPAVLMELPKPLVVQLQESEFQTRLIHSRNHPRDIHRAMESMVRMATWSEEFADDMTFSIPRGGKIITGPTIRFAEVVKQCWGHGDEDAYVIRISKEEKQVVVRGWYYDFEMDNKVQKTVYRSIRDKQGNVFSDDMISVTCNAACSIARREAILAGIPRPAWMNAWEAAKRRAAGGVEGLQKKREEVLRTFLQAGVGPDRVLAAIDVKSEAHITQEHINTLRGMWSAHRNGEATLDEMFVPVRIVADTNGAPPKKKTLADLAKDPDTALKVSKDDLHEIVEDQEQAQENALDPDPDSHQARLIEETRDLGRRAYHRGATKPASHISQDPELLAVWQEEWDATREATLREDDEDTAGAE